MNERWQSAKTSIIIKYLIIISIAAIIYNIWYNGGFTSSVDLGAATVGEIKVQEIQSIEISIENLEYRIPSSQYGQLTNALSDLKPTEILSRKDKAKTSCLISMTLKNDHEYRLQVKEKNQQTPKVVFIEMQQGNKTWYGEHAYLAEDLCARMTDR